MKSFEQLIYEVWPTSPERKAALAIALDNHEQHFGLTMTRENVADMVG